LILVFLSYFSSRNDVLTVMELRVYVVFPFSRDLEKTEKQRINDEAFKLIRDMPSINT
jgi:hypothetical protein